MRKKELKKSKAKHEKFLSKLKQLGQENFFMIYKEKEVKIPVSLMENDIMIYDDKFLKTIDKKDQVKVAKKFDKFLMESFGYDQLIDIM